MEYIWQFVSSYTLSFTLEPQPTQTDQSQEIESMSQQSV